MASSPAALTSRVIRLVDECSTRKLGQRLASALRRGDSVLISGQLGAGKSALARAIIRAKLCDAEADVPSPSYTLINVYELPDRPGEEIWHVDLYRIPSAEEALELGLEDAIDRVLLIVEWPERLGDFVPGRRAEIRLATLGADERLAEIVFHGPDWERAQVALEAL